DLLLHVIDVADERQAENMQQVQDVLHEIGADEIPQLLICNKIDKLADGTARIDTNDEGLPIRVWLSAQTGDGIDLLQEALVQRLRPSMVDVSLRIPPSMGKLRGKLYAMKSVTGEEACDDGRLALHVRMSAVDWQRLSKQVAEEYGDSLQGF